jgi:predicted chitinase
MAAEEVKRNYQFQAGVREGRLFMNCTHEGFSVFELIGFLNYEIQRLTDEYNKELAKERAMEKMK